MTNEHPARGVQRYTNTSGRDPGKKKSKPTVIWTGDLNFHIVEWEERGAACGCGLKCETENNGSADEKEQLKKITNTRETFNLV